MTKKVSRNPFEMLSKSEVEESAVDLGWKPYPACMIEAIDRIEQLYFQLKGQKKLNSRDVRSLLEQFVWSNIARQPHEPQVFDLSRMRGDYNPIRGLETADYIFQKIAKAQEEKDQKNLFHAFFGAHTSGAGEVVLYLLSLATQIAASTRNAVFLKCCSYWMRDCGLDSCQVEYVVNDFVKELVTPDTFEEDNGLPEYALEFSKDIVMAVAKLYIEKDKPKALISNLCSWIEQYPSVCFNPPRSAIFDLFRWDLFCVSQESRLHAALLSAIHRAGKGFPLQVIPHVMQIFQEFRQHCDAYCRQHGLPSLRSSILREKMKSSSDISEHASHKLKRRTLKMQMCRLFQIIQMLLSAGCLEDNEIHPIFQAYEGMLEFRFSFYMQLKSLHGLMNSSQSEPPSRARKSAQTRGKTSSEKVQKGKRNQDVGKGPGKIVGSNTRSVVKNEPSYDKLNEDGFLDSDDEDYFDRKQLLLRIKATEQVSCINANGTKSSETVRSTDLMDTS